MPQSLTLARSHTSSIKKIKDSCEKISWVLLHGSHFTTHYGQYLHLHHHWFELHNHLCTGSLQPRSQSDRALIVTTFHWRERGKIWGESENAFTHIFPIDRTRGCNRHITLQLDSVTPLPICLHSTHRLIGESNHNWFFINTGASYWLYPTFSW